MKDSSLLSIDAVGSKVDSYSVGFPSTLLEYFNFLSFLDDLTAVVTNYFNDKDFT